MIVISFSSLWKLFIKVRKKGAGGWKGIRNKINYIENNSINVSFFLAQKHLHPL